MRVSKIQPTIYSNHNQNRVSRITNLLNEPETKPVEQVSFKGNGKGAIAGLTTGLVTSLAAVGGAAIAGTLVLPALIGGAVVLGTGLACAAIGDKIEDKITKNKKG